MTAFNLQASNLPLEKAILDVVVEAGVIDHLKTSFFERLPV